MKIVIAGASGFLGSNLKHFFEEKKRELILLSRHPKNGEVSWSPEEGKLDGASLEGTDVVINLCGENIFGRWSKAKLERIKKSRFLPTKLLAETLIQLKHPPKLFVNASAVGYYGDRGDQILTEETERGSGILPEICEEWEGYAKKVSQAPIRLVLARFGIVLGQGGVLEKMKTAFKLGLGGKLATGKQYMSWVALEDLLEAFEHVIQHPELSGPVNVTSPQPVTNKEFTKELSEATKTPAWMDVPSPAISLVFGSGKEMLLSSTRAEPKKLLASGFVFKYQDLASALKLYVA